MKFNFKIPENTHIIFTDEANKFVQDLHNKFGGKIQELLANRAERQSEFNAGKLPNFLDETKDIRSSDWHVREIPNDLKDRRVEITGPVDRKMVINALNADVKVFMADFEEEEYFSDSFFSLFSTMSFDTDVNDDRSFLFEDEMDFTTDLFTVYFIVWGKFAYFWLFILEEIARVALALYVTYLLIFEINAINRSYSEDFYLSAKRSNFTSDPKVENI